LPAGGGVGDDPLFDDLRAVEQVEGDALLGCGEIGGAVRTQRGQLGVRGLG
jgi:hypothetical protein